MRRSLKWSIALAGALAWALYSPRAAAVQYSPDLRDLSTLSIPERLMIESACRRDRQASGSAYSSCVRQQLDALQASAGSPDLNAISGDERQMIESACRPDQQMGPAAYYRCLRAQIGALHASAGSPDLTAISDVDRQRIESACHLDGQVSGPAAYYRCLHRQVDALPTTRRSRPESQASSRKTTSPPQSPSSQQSNEDSAGPDTSSQPVQHSEADSVSTSGNQPVESSPHPASSSSHGTLTLWLAGLLVIGSLATILYNLVKPKKCGRCGNSTKTRGAYCDACAAQMDDSARRVSEQRAAEQRAKDEAERYARAQWEIEESHRVSVLAELHRLTEPQFQDLITSLFKKDGYTVRRCGSGGDEGIDLVLEMGQEKDVAQCKTSKNDAEAAVVREFYGALMHAGARHGFIVTTASFSQSARDFARGKPMTLVSAAEILQWIDGTYSSSGSDHRAIRPKTIGDGKAFDPYEVLGVSRNASPEEIRAAYRREIVNYHPDKVAHLAKEFQELAQTKAQEINRAYEELAHPRNE